MTQLYEGLSNKTKVSVLVFSAIIAIANLGLAWYVADKALNEIPISNNDVEEIKSLSSDLIDPNIYANNLNLRVHAINTQVHLKGITNKQSIIIVSIGSGFAFIAIGFALFLIGADGALHVKNESIDSKLMLSATAPGIVCFVLAAILIFMGVTREYKLDIGNTKFLNINEVQYSNENTEQDYPNP